MLRREEPIDRLSVPPPCSIPPTKSQLRPLDPQRLLRQRLHHLKRQEAQNVHHILADLAVRARARAQAGPLPELGALPARERRLPRLGPLAVLVARHAPRALVRQRQAPQLRAVLLRVLLRVLRVLPFQLRRALGEEGRRVPRQRGPARLDFGGGAVQRQDIDVCEVAVVERVGAALVVLLFRVLAELLPGEERLEAGDLFRVVADEEDEVFGGCDLGAAAVCEVGGAGELWAGASMRGVLGGGKVGRYELDDLLADDAFDEGRCFGGEVGGLAGDEHHL